LKKNTSHTALHEKEGILQPNSFNQKLVGKLKKRRKTFSPDEMISEIVKGNQVMLSRAITLIESNADKHQDKARQLIELALTHAKPSLRIGITGVPGVGKSTFIESFGMHLVSLGKKVAVLAVDPSSSISRGSILGDKTRMESLVKEPHAFIRPSASGTSLGGVAQKTRETIALCEAAGFDVIIVETVGVGQSETVVHSMTDFFLLLKLAGAGDELQGIKRGIMEMADCIVINKADGENKKAARMAKAEFSRALRLFPEKENGWKPEVLQASALNHEGIDEVWEMISAYFKLVRSNHYFQHKRQEQNKYWLKQTIDEHLKRMFYDNPKIKAEMEIQLQKIEKNLTSPFEAARKLIELYTLKDIS
jgi:LAO/AO transport system kinase